VTTHLRCQNVTVRFGGLLACDKVSLDVERGKIVGLIGPNGAGKTTLFNVLSRFQDADEGELYYEDRSIRHMKPHDMVAVGMARTFQNINLFGEQSTLDNILIGAHRLIGNPFSHLYSLPHARRRERELVSHATDIAHMLNLDNELDNAAKNLPYGYQKRVELARAWPRARRSSCSTSRWPAATTRRPPRCAGSCSASTRSSASRYCWSSTTWRWS
jgi:branched-chain amino acid transport system ATP-binding protein